MKCPCCNGTGIDDDRLTCYRCGGTGEVEMTKQEYLQTCTTEQLAEELLAWWVDGADIYSQFGLFQHEIDGAKEKIMKWLKEIHE